MAALPAAFVAQGLYDQSLAALGMVTAYDALGAPALLERLAAEGYELRVSTGGRPL